MPCRTARFIVFAALALLGACVPSASMRLTAAILRVVPTMPSDPAELDRQVVGRTYPQVPAFPAGFHRRYQIDEHTVLGHRVIRVAPKTGGSRNIIVYTHGGSYVYELGRFHWGILDALIQSTGATVIVPIYPLAPEHPYTDAYALLDRVYRDLLAEVPAERIVLCGDSAGGGLALGQAIALRDQGLPLPGRVVLFSPWLDLILSNPEIPALDPIDAMLDAGALRHLGAWWAAGADLRAPYLSPLWADLQGLPPIDVYQGTADLLWPDARALRDRVHEVGGKISLHETEGGFHVFMGATYTPEARRVYAQVAEGLGVTQPLTSGWEGE
jgi:monoterpene epsilon-lactone hydrolase